MDVGAGSTGVTCGGAMEEGFGRFCPKMRRGKVCFYPRRRMRILYSREYMGDTFDHAFFRIYDNNVIDSAVYVIVQKKGKASIGL